MKHRIVHIVGRREYTTRLDNEISYVDIILCGVKFAFDIGTERLPYGPLKLVLEYESYDPNAKS
jgi:hypothetical protein